MFPPAVIKKEGVNGQSPSWCGLSVSSLLPANPALTSKRFTITSRSWKLLIYVSGFPIHQNIHFNLCSQANENFRHLSIEYTKTVSLEHTNWQCMNCSWHLRRMNRGHSLAISSSWYIHGLCARGENCTFLWRAVITRTKRETNMSRSAQVERRENHNGWTNIWGEK